MLSVKKHANILQTLSKSKLLSLILVFITLQLIRFNLTMNFKPDFVYKGGNKKEAKSMKHEYISIPPPVIDLPPPMQYYIETP